MCPDEEVGIEWPSKLCGWLMPSWVILCYTSEFSVSFAVKTIYCCELSIVLLDVIGNARLFTRSFCDSVEMISTAY